MSSFADDEFPASPYPGSRPAFSYAHDTDGGHRLTADASTLSGWRIGNEDLDAWLGARGAAVMAERVPVLSYGSNPCPSKISWLRGSLGLRGAVVVLRARCSGLAAVWAAGLRVVDEQRPVVLAGCPGVVEDHAVLMVTPEQVGVLDMCEGRGDRYRLARVSTGAVTLVDAQGTFDRIPAYVGASTIRRPLLVNGSPVRCVDVPQAEAVALSGVPALDDGLDTEVITGSPRATDYPGAVFVYGTLRPSSSHWHLLAPHAAGPTRPGRLAGTLYDTGFGYPALALGDGPGVSGDLVPLRSGTDMTALDRYEGDEYRRVRVVLTDGSLAWTYVWIAPFDDMRILATPWPPNE
ncbi:gamma-glutamylcyclotransferase family protein [Actinokineospora enzanensis]|uniref:gamma-glutamylcyclotransferase family protein n=1 Tax=Actinokineospora enzanensis TaxID=155975 RepID=UPI000370AA3D|nr:gamma-glutamylcyclotransferase family protein [Actinokineospora enzanensis]